MKKVYLFSLALIGLFSAIILSLTLGNNDSNILEDLGLKNLTTEEIILELDSKILDGDVYSSSVTGEYLLISTGSESLKLDIPEDKFYLSFAPYIDNTHTCGTHNLVTCRGELKNESFNVLIEDTNGNVIVDEVMTSFDSGFIGIWLPADMDLSITVSQDGLEATKNISTYEYSDTCLTTLQLQ